LADSRKRRPPRNGIGPLLPSAISAHRFSAYSGIWQTVPDLNSRYRICIMDAHRDRPPPILIETCQEPAMDYEELLKRILDIDPEYAGENEFALLEQAWEGLRSGVIRAAEKSGDSWAVNRKVKEVILWAFRAGVLRDVPGHDFGGVFSFTDKNTLPTQSFDAGSGRRIVPGGTSIRDGCFVARGVIIMPPSYVNIGAYVDKDTLIDSHVLVGSCAQIGKRVHLSAAVQIGGVLEPVGAVPVIIEDDVLVGGNCGIYEGTIVRTGAVIGTGVILTASTPVYDLVREAVYRKTPEHPLEIPESAVVVQGCRPARSAFAEKHGIQIYTPVIVKYRDDRTSAATALEESLR
jgi:2,3,4,5-tetrahydropyridine-2,6-dicarboxylate N-succinyltransferase